MARIIARSAATKQSPRESILRGLAHSARTAFFAGMFMMGFFISTAQATPTAPDFTLKDLSGKSVTLSSFREKSPVLLVFTATWCPYCRKQIPALIELRKKTQLQDLAIYAVDVQEDRDKVAAFAASKGINYPVLLDTAGKASDLFGASGIPFFVLIDRTGNVVATDYGVSSNLLKKITALTKTKPALTRVK